MSKVSFRCEIVSCVYLGGFLGGFLWLLFERAKIAT